MPIRQPSDSLSRCDPQIYSNLYDTRKRADIKQEPIVATRPVHKDTLEISRDQLKKEALNRLRHSAKYQVLQSGFMRIGKYVFLAIAFPPYLVVYGIPKWILTAGIPTLSSLCMTIAEKVKKKIKKRLDTIKQKISEVVQLMQQKIVQLMSPVIRLTLDIRQAFHRMRQAAQLFVKRITNQVKSASSKIFRSPKKAMQALRTAGKWTKEKVNQWLKEAISRKEQIQDWAQKQLHQIQSFFSWLPQLPQWGMAQLGHLQIRAQKLAQPWKAKFNLSQHLAHRSADWLTKQISKGTQAIRLLFNPIQAFYSRTFKPAAKTFKDYLKKKRDFFGQKKQNFLNALHKKQEKINQMNFQHVIDRIRAFCHSSAIPKGWQLLLRKWIENRRVQVFLKAGFTLFSKTLKGVLQATGFFIKLLSQAGDLLLKGYASISQRINLLFECIGIGTGAAKKWIRKGVYYFLLSLIMLNILLLWGGQLLGEAMYHLLAFSFKNKIILQHEKTK